MVYPKRPAKILDLTWRGTPLRDGLKTLSQIGVKSDMKEVKMAVS
jgi:DMSO/TMAO reductase YedYZ molybdopterin-dependent catalytic subunit